jgi:hypothetical protein
MLPPSQTHRCHRQQSRGALPCHCTPPHFQHGWLHDGHTGEARQQQGARTGRRQGRSNGRCCVLLGMVGWVRHQHCRLCCAGYACSGVVFCLLNQSLKNEKASQQRCMWYGSIQARTVHAPSSPPLPAPPSTPVTPPHTHTHTHRCRCTTTAASPAPCCTPSCTINVHYYKPLI